MRLCGVRSISVAAIIGVSGIATADPTIHLVPGKPSLDDPAPRAFFDSSLPAGQAFTLEVQPPDSATDRATLVITVNDKRCDAIVHVRIPDESEWGRCPQHYVLAMAVSGDGDSRVLRATVPALQVDQAYHFYIHATAPLGTAVLADMPERIAGAVEAGAANNGPPPECQPSYTPPSGAYDPTADIACALASAINDAISADPNHKLPVPRPVTADEVLALARHATALIDAPDAPAAKPAAAPAPTPAPPTGAKSTSVTDQAAGLLAQVITWLAAALPHAAATGPAANGPGNGATTKPLNEPAVADGPSSESSLHPLVDFQERQHEYGLLAAALKQADVTRETKLAAAKVAVTGLTQTSVRIFDPDHKLVRLDQLWSDTTPKATFAFAVGELKALLDASDPNDAALRQRLVAWIDALNGLAGAADLKAALKSATKPAIPANVEPVFVGPFHEPQRPFESLSALATSSKDEKLSSADDFAQQFEAYAAYDTAPSWTAALTAVREFRIASDASFAEQNVFLAQAAQLQAATSALTARVIKVMTDLKTSSLLRASTQAVEIVGSAGYGATPDAGSYASPDFGVVAAIPYVSGSAQDLWLLPYFGLNLYAVPVDRKIAFTHIAGSRFYRHFLQRTSLTVGVTLTSPSLTGYTVTGPLWDRFPVVAIGYRLTHFVRLTAGAAMYRVSSPNPIDAKTSVAAAPFVGISVDTDIIDIAKNGFSHL